MIAQRTTSSLPMILSREETVQAAMALLNQRQAVGAPRWDCDICGMIHSGQTPVACESCGSTSLSRHVVLHREMNNHW